MSTGSTVWHEYRDGKTLCGGTWFPTGSAPCELADLDLRDDLNDNLPECEASDEDIAALKELLGQPHVGYCRAQGRASWFKPDPKPPHVIVASSAPDKHQSLARWISIADLARSMGRGGVGEGEK